MRTGQPLTGTVAKRAANPWPTDKLRQVKGLATGKLTQAKERPIVTPAQAKGLPAKMPARARGLQTATLVRPTALPAGEQPGVNGLLPPVNPRAAGLPAVEARPPSQGVPRDTTDPALALPAV